MKKIVWMSTLILSLLLFTLISLLVTSIIVLFSDSDVLSFTQGLHTLLNDEGTVTLEFPHLLNLMRLKT